MKERVLCFFGGILILTLIATFMKQLISEMPITTFRKEAVAKGFAHWQVNSNSLDVEFRWNESNK